MTDPLARMAIDLVEADAHDFLRTSPSNTEIVHYQGQLEEVESRIHQLCRELAARSISLTEESTDAAA